MWVFQAVATIGVLAVVFPGVAVLLAIFTPGVSARQGWVAFGVVVLGVFAVVGSGVGYGWTLVSNGQEYLAACVQSERFGWVETGCAEDDYHKVCGALVNRAHAEEVEPEQVGTWARAQGEDRCEEEQLEPELIAACESAAEAAWSTSTCAGRSEPSDWRGCAVMVSRERTTAAHGEREALGWCFKQQGPFEPQAWHTMGWVSEGCEAVSAPQIQQTAPIGLDGVARDGGRACLASRVSEG